MEVKKANIKRVKIFMKLPKRTVNSTKNWDKGHYILDIREIDGR